MGNGAAFRKGREFAAWLEAVPHEHSADSKQKLPVSRGNPLFAKTFRARSTCGRATT